MVALAVSVTFTVFGFWFVAVAKWFVAVPVVPFAVSVGFTVFVTFTVFGSRFVFVASPVFVAASPGPFPPPPPGPAAASGPGAAPGLSGTAPECEQREAARERGGEPPPEAATRLQLPTVLCVREVHRGVFPPGPHDFSL